MASDSLQKAANTQIANIEKQTGKPLHYWTKLVNESGFSKHGELVSWLKDKHGFTYGNANLVVHYAKQSHAGAGQNETDWVAEQYKGKENLKPLYNVLMKFIETLGKDVEVAPKKTYVSLRRKKQFAIIQPSAKTRLDVGLNLKEANADARLEAAGSWNSMCTHRIKILSEADLDDSLRALLQKAFEQAG